MFTKKYIITTLLILMLILLISFFIFKQSLTYSLWQISIAYKSSNIELLKKHINTNQISQNVVGDIIDFLIEINNTNLTKNKLSAKPQTEIITQSKNILLPILSLIRNQISIKVENIVIKNIEQKNISLINFLNPKMFGKDIEIVTNYFKLLKKENYQNYTITSNKNNIQNLNINFCNEHKKCTNLLFNIQKHDDFWQIISLTNLKTELKKFSY